MGTDFSKIGKDRKGGVEVQGHMEKFRVTRHLTGGAYRGRMKEVSRVIGKSYSSDRYSQKNVKTTEISFDFSQYQVGFQGTTSTAVKGNRG